MHLLGLLILAASPAAAQRPDPARTVDQLAQCQSIAADAERLACFDEATRTITAARRDGRLLVLDRQKVVERKRARFGLGPETVTGPASDLEENAAALTEVTTSVVATVPAVATGRWNLQLANGSVWQTVETTSFPPRKGAPITVRAANLGGFRASVKGGRSFLVKRLR